MIHAKFSDEKIEITAPTPAGLHIAGRAAVRWISGTRKWGALVSRCSELERQVFQLQQALAQSERQRIAAQRLLWRVREKNICEK